MMLLLPKRNWQKNKTRRAGDAAALGMAVHEARHAPLTSSGWNAVLQRGPNAEFIKKRAQAAGKGLLGHLEWKAAMANDGRGPERRGLVFAPIG
jgi:hypothetical protein